MTRPSWAEGRQSCVAGCVLIIIALLAAGTGLYRDYGISWDEPVQREYGETVYNYIAEGDQSLLADRHRVYGPVFEVLLYSMERGLALEDTRETYFMRHIVTFLMFAAGVVFFYFLAGRMLASYKMGFLGALLLVVSPRIFAHAFYNSKDIPFMAVFIICMYTLLLHLDRKMLWTSLLHGITCAVLVDIRIMGMFVPLLTVICFVYEMIASDPADEGKRRTVVNFCVFCASLIPMTVLLWPTLWNDPVGNFAFAFQAMSKFAWRAPILFMGSQIWSTELPPHYTLVYMVITTPVIYVILGAGGVVAAIGRIAGRRIGPPVKRRDILFVLLWLFAPLAFLIASEAVVYDTWRHTFFVYPAVLLLALAGLGWFTAGLRAALGHARGRVAVAAVALLLAVNICGALRFMIGAHPHQNVYFNSIVGGINGAAGKYEMDYWGLSYRALLESLLEKDGREAISVYALNEPGYYNSFILPASERKRLVYAERPADADYYITNFRWDPARHPDNAESAAVSVDGVRLAAAYRMR